MLRSTQSAQYKAKEHDSKRVVMTASQRLLSAPSATETHRPDPGAWPGWGRPPGSSSKLMVTVSAPGRRRPAGDSNRRRQRSGAWPGWGRPPQTRHGSRRGGRRRRRRRACAPPAEPPPRSATRIELQCRGRFHAVMAQVSMDLSTRYRHRLWCRSSIDDLFGVCALNACSVAISICRLSKPWRWVAAAQATPEAMQQEVCQLLQSCSPATRGDGPRCTAGTAIRPGAPSAARRG